MFGLLKSIFSQFSEDRCTVSAAALAYYTVFALPPLLYLLILIVAAGMSVAYEDQEAEQRAESLVQRQAAEMLGAEAASDEIGEILDQNQRQGGRWWKSLLSLAGILFGATGVMAALQDSLNTVWRVQPNADVGGLWNFVNKRLLSFAMILGLGFLMLASLIVSTLLTALADQVTQLLHIERSVAFLIDFAMQFLVTLLVFAAVFKFMPDAITAWRDVFLGAAVTAVLFLIGRWALQFYFTSFSPGSELGSAAASLAVIMVWVYYSSIILLLGAEFTQCYAERFGSGVRPEANAVRVIRQTQASSPSR